MTQVSVSSIEYTVSNGLPVVHLFGRDLDKNRVLVKDHTQKSHFYVREKDRYSLPSEVRRVEFGFKHFLTKESMVKAITSTPSEVGTAKYYLSNKGVESFQADILFPDVYVYEKNFRVGIDSDTLSPTEFYITPRVLYLDIEVESKDNNSFPIAERVPILAIGIMDSYTGEKRVFENTRKPSITQEREILLQLIASIREFDPDVISGFNIEGFDLPYIIKRMRLLNVSPSQLSPMNKYRFDEEKERITISGREIFDLAKAYRKYYLKELEAELPKALHTICLMELGKGQLKFEEPMGLVWKKDPKKVVEHNITDLDLEMELDEHCGLMELYEDLRRFTGVRFRHIFTNYKIAERLVIPRYNAKGLVLPNRAFDEEGETYRGAIIEAIVGIYDNVLALDFSAFYPYIIIYYNISPETRSPTGDLILGDVRFSSKEEGIIPSILKEMISLRATYKLKLKLGKETLSSQEKDKLDRQSTVLKFIINAIYGSLAYPKSRWYDKKLAESTTFGARKHITILKDESEKRGFKVVYVHTDSLFMLLPEGTNPKEVLDMANEVSKPLELDIKGVYDRLIVITKARYAGLHMDGHIERVGLECIRTDSPLLFRNLQREVIDDILTRKDKEVIVKKIREAIRKTSKLEVPLREIAIPRTLRKQKGAYKKLAPPFHLRAVEASKALLGIEFSKGAKLLILPIKHRRHKWVAIPEDFTIEDFNKNNLGSINIEELLKRLKSMLNKVTKLYNIDWLHITNLGLDRFLYTNV